jgi:hypothetical protein
MILGTIDSLVILPLEFTRSTEGREKVVHLGVKDCTSASSFEWERRVRADNWSSPLPRRLTLKLDHQPSSFALLP